MVDKSQIDIKQISIRQVEAVKSVLAKSGFVFENVKEDSSKEGYTTYGTRKTSSVIIVVRLSNHICSMKNWTERYKAKLIAKPKLLRRMGKNIQDPYKERCFFSIVFKAFDYSVNDSGSWKAICNEYVFNPIEVEEGGTIGIIANDAKGLNRGNSIKINGIQPQIREVNNENGNPPQAKDIVPQNISVDKDGNWVSANGWGADYVSENKQYNNNRNMKQTIKLRESELKRMISESVRRILNEGNYLPDGYDDEWEKNVDDDSNYNVDFDRPSRFGFPTLRNPYKDAQQRLSTLNDTDSVGQPNNAIFGIDSTPYGNEYWMYDREGNKTYNGYKSIYDKDNIRYDSDEWDYDNDQPMWKTHMNNKNYNVPTSPFAADERSLKRKSYMAKGGGYEQDLAKLKRNSDRSTQRAMDAADKRPLHRKGSLNRAMDESIDRIVNKCLKRKLR